MLLIGSSAMTTCNQCNQCGCHGELIDGNLPTQERVFIEQWSPSVSDREQLHVNSFIDYTHKQQHTVWSELLRSAIHSAAKMFAETKLLV